MMKQTKGEKIFSVFNIIFLTMVSLATLYPFLYVLSASFSSPTQVVTGHVWLFPVDLCLDAYAEVIAQKGIWIAYGNSIVYTVGGTLIAVFLTICGAYPLSKARLRGKTFFAMMVAFTMWFHAGMIPVYLNLKSFGLVNNRFVMIIAFGCSAFYVILLRTYYQSIPASLEESAKIDGANDLMILTKIYLPLSTPAIATITLYYAVNKWNEFFWAMVLLRDDKKIPLQVLLRKLVVEMKGNEMLTSMDAVTNYSAETVSYAVIMIAVLPMIIIYPYIQKYFVKGIMIGSVKG